MPKEDYISATKIDTINYCSMRFYLKYGERPKPAELNLSAFVKGKLFHKAIENFWLLMKPIAYENELYLKEEVSEYKKRHSQKIDLLLTKKRKRKEFSIKKKKESEIYKYYDAESFAEYLKGQWYRSVMADKSLREKLNNQNTLSEKRKKNLEKRLISWEFDDEPYVIANKIPDITKTLYNYLFKEGPPLYTEVQFKFKLNNVQLNGEDIIKKPIGGFIDEIRIRNGKVVIRDYKTGSPFEIKEMKIEFDPQLTLYNLGLCSLCYEDEELSKILGVSEIKHQFMGNPIFIYPEFEQEFFMIEAPYIIELANKPAPKKEDFDSERKYQEEHAKWKIQKDRIKNIPEITHTTKRHDFHFYELAKMISRMEQITEGKDVYAESGRKCDRCSMKKACKNKIEKSQDKIKIDEKGQRFFSFIDSPTIISIREEVKQNQEKYVQRLFDFRRKEPWRGRV